MSDPKTNIERINEVRRRAVTTPRRPPVGWHRCPDCQERLRVVTFHGHFPPFSTVMDGLASALYACPKDRLLWIHEVGGIVAVDHWLGPLPAEAGELEGITPLIPENGEGTP